MAINEKPPNSDSDATNNESDAKINDHQQSNSLPNSNIDPDSDLKKNLLIPVSPQTSSSVSPTKATESPTTHQQRRRWWQMWQIWGILLVLCSGGVGYGATSMLLKLPKTQSCSKVFWPVASASIRLYCAQTSAEKKNVDGLLAAINLVAVLPDNHPLSSEINRNIDRWATSILAIGESEFQSGKLEQAIATAKKIPQGVSAQKLVDQKIADWKSIWSDGEAIYLEVENKLRAADWDGAINSAVRLTESPNKYWATTKYEESINNINVAQEENASLSKAQIQVTNGRIDDLILAIDRADDIGEKSYTYNQAQKIITEAKGKLMASIEQLIENKDWQELLRVSNKIPSSLKLQKRVKDWQILANAGSSAQLDTVFGIEEAIEEVKKLKKNSEYYPLGQNLIRRWKLEIEDVRHLAKARELARVGTISNLNEAITEARLIPNSNPRYSDAQQEINGWRRQIQIIEDQPILDRAKELSYSSNVNAWQRAIAEANLISSNSPLYGEAQDNVRTWRTNIERVQDQPILNEADSLANMDNYPAAINTASRIRSGRALYSEAQRKIALWQAEIDGERYLREATELADEGTPEALAQAIRIARQAPARSSVNSQVVIDVNDWAAEILDMARDAADDDSLESAIEIAGLVPYGTTSFTTAQEEIKIWKIELYPELELPPSFKLEKLKKELN
ncbi:MAG: chromosome segregation ATPase [Waterburya sp.]